MEAVSDQLNEKAGISSPSSSSSSSSSSGCS